MGVNRKHPPISIHQTLNGILQVNWQQEYNNEFICPCCEQGKITQFYYRKKYLCEGRLCCNSCGKQISLTCEVLIHIHGYCPELECPNPLCTKLGHNGQKGWIYKIADNIETCQCYFCKVQFNPNSTAPFSWVGSQQKNILHPFNFEDDIWDLRHFYKKPRQKTINFQNIQPKWYKLKVKKYMHYLLRNNVYNSDSSIQLIIISLRQLGEIIELKGLPKSTEVVRETILAFLDTQRRNKEKTICYKLSTVRDFLEWLGLDAVNLVRRRDFPKRRQNETDWLDELTRTAIKQHLHKIPAPIARHYLIQEYTAARPGDICSMKLDCLVEENGQWYIQFYQQKVNRWHRIPANREIRRVIEEQQQWIRDTLGADYSYLFCHFRSFNVNSYPNFPNIKPLPEPPKVQNSPMVRIIRMLIEQENILDANGQKPHFTGKITRSSRLQEIRVKHGIEVAQIYADHKSSKTTVQHYTPPTREEVAKVDLPFQELLLNPENKFLPWQSLPESLLKTPKKHELDMELSPRLVVYGHCTLDPKTPCIYNLYPKCYGCSSFRPSTGKLPLYERQYAGEQQRLKESEKTGAELVYEEAKAIIEAMDKWLDDLRRLNNGE